MSSVKRRERRAAKNGPEIGSRQPQPLNATKPAFSPMLVRRKVVSLVRIESTGWSRRPELETPTEICTLTAHLSDGTTVTREARIDYEPGQRERLLEAVLSSSGTAADLRLAINIRARRWQLVQDAYAALQREYAG